MNKKEIRIIFISKENIELYNKLKKKADDEGIFITQVVKKLLRDNIK